MKFIIIKFRYFISLVNVSVCVLALLLHYIQIQIQYTFTAYKQCVLHVVKENKLNQSDYYRVSNEDHIPYANEQYDYNCHVILTLSVFENWNKFQTLFYQRTYRQS